MTLPIDDRLCFSLYAASRAVTALYRPMLDELDLTYPQYLVMVALWDGGPAQVKDLGETLSLDSGTLSPLLKRLEKAGLVRRERRAEDERTVWVTLTGDGEALKDRTEPLVPDTVDEAMGLDAAQARALRKTLRELTTSVTEFRGRA